MCATGEAGQPAESNLAGYGRLSQGKQCFNLTESDGGTDAPCTVSDPRWVDRY